MSHVDEIVERLHKELSEGTWQPIKVHQSKEINDGIALKKRIIVCPNFIQEQIVHHAIMRVCSPLFMKRFYQYSCGSVPTKGREFAVKYLRSQFKNRKRTKYFCKLDIKKFFDSVKPLVAFRTLRRLIADKKVLLLFAKILRSNKLLMPDGSIVAKGLPIGFYTSPWIANLVLSSIDHKLKDELKVSIAVRYIDDILLFHGNKRKLARIVNTIEKDLHGLCLSFKHRPAIHSFDKQDVTFIGYKFSRDKIILNDKAFLRATRMANKISQKSTINVYDARRVVSLIGKFKAIDGKSAYQKYVLDKLSIKYCKRVISRKDRVQHDFRVEKSSI